LAIAKIKNDTQVQAQAQAQASNNLYGGTNTQEILNEINNKSTRGSNKQSTYLSIIFIIFVFFIKHYAKKSPERTINWNLFIPYKYSQHKL